MLSSHLNYAPGSPAAALLVLRRLVAMDITLPPRTVEGYSPALIAPGVCGS